MDKVEKIDMTYLEKVNPCKEFDDFITFNEEEHIYTVDGEQYDGSVTGFVHDFFPHFEPDTVIDKMMKSKNWPKSKYHGMTKDEIKSQWDQNKDEAASMGTVMHATIEKFYNHPDLYQTKNLDETYLAQWFDPEWLECSEFKQFLKFHQDVPVTCRWKPFRTELRVFDRDWRLAGSVDMLYYSPEYTEENRLLVMGDWKRSREIKDKNHFERGNPPLDNLPHANFWHYSLQLNTYKYLIEKNTPYRIQFMFLGVFHPNQTTYQMIAVNHLPECVQKMFQVRARQMATRKKEEK
jgi:hypothetical protein